MTDTGGNHTCFRLAHIRSCYDKTKEDWIDDPTLLFTVRAYGLLAINLESSLKKGDIVYVAGTLKAEPPESDVYMTKTTSLVVEADMVAHDLTRGTSSYVRDIRHNDEVETQEEVNVQLPNPKSDWQPFFQDFYFGTKKQPLNPQEEENKNGN
jgi:single-strand DNA-binding protein